MKAKSMCVAIAAGALVTALSTVLATQAAQVPAAATDAPAGNAEAGKTLFLKVGCYQCHGGEAQGGVAGPRLAPDPMPFRALVAYVRAPRGEMPPYTAKVMSEAQLADIYAFLRTRPRPAAVDSIPLLAP